MDHINRVKENILSDLCERAYACGHAYPCFCTPEELDHVRQEQEKNKDDIVITEHMRHVEV
ncbi:hypothetical protein C823_008039 [Eubacterium plexicaudatum ASF492]|nr:hypothetical protein C823_008039 [Eubacterium plexicaudatum ASF492]